MEDTKNNKKTAHVSGSQGGLGKYRSKPLVPNETRMYTRWGNFWITISPNKITDTADEEQDMADKLHAAAAEMGKDMRPYLRLHQPTRSNFRFPPIDFQRDIKKISVEYSVEKGTDSRGGRVHMHMLVRVEHTTNPLIDKDALTSLIERHTKLANPYINIRGISTDLDKIRRYMFKDMRGGTKMSQSTEKTDTATQKEKHVMSESKRVVSSRTDVSKTIHEK